MTKTYLFSDILEVDEPHQLFDKGNLFSSLFVNTIFNLKNLIIDS